MKSIALTVEGLHPLEKLRLDPGTLTLVMGPNGAGKTALLEKWAGLRDPEGLTIRYGSEPLWLPRKGKKSKRLNPLALLSYGYAGQSPEQALFRRTLEEELLFSLRPYINREERGGKAPKAEPASTAVAMEQALEKVGLNGSWLSRDPHRMSGGERRRAALASLFVTEAPWLLLDEPTAGLDLEGHEKLSVHLENLKREGRGIVLVSHDSDWALSLAERVLLIHPGGAVRACGPHDLISHPEWMAEAGLQVPEWMRIVRLAWESGDVGLERLWDPSRTAEWLPDMVSDPSERSARRVEKPSERRVPLEWQANISVTLAPHAITRFDPRAVWLGYVLLAAGLFSLSSWGGLLVGATIVGLLLAVARIPLKRWKSLMVGFLYFSVILACFAAIGPASEGTIPLKWEGRVFVGTLFPFTRTFTVLLIGLSLPLVMTPLSLRRALEQLTPANRKTPEWWQRVVLTVTLTIRFVPVLLAEWERFGRIFLARGKETRRSPRIFFRRLREVTLPLLFALFRLGEEVAVALESRGVRRNANPTKSSRLNWLWRDTVLAVSAAVLAGALWLLD